MFNNLKELNYNSRKSARQNYLEESDQDDRPTRVWLRELALLAEGTKNTQDTH